MESPRTPEACLREGLGRGNEGLGSGKEEKAALGVVGARASQALLNNPSGLGSVVLLWVPKGHLCKDWLGEETAALHVVRDLLQALQGGGGSKN